MSCFTFLLRTAQQRSKSLSLYARTVGTDSYKPPTHIIHSFAYYFLIAYIIYCNIFLFFYLAVKSLLIQYRLNCVLNAPASRWVNYNLRATLFFFPCLSLGSLLYVPFHQTGLEGGWFAMNPCSESLALKDVKAGLSIRYTKGNCII